VLKYFCGKLCSAAGQTNDRKRARRVSPAWPVYEDLAARKGKVQPCVGGGVTVWQGGWHLHMARTAGMADHRHW